MNKALSICLSALLFDVNAMCHSFTCDIPIEFPRAIRFISFDDLVDDQYDDRLDIDYNVSNEGFCVLSENPILMFGNCCYDDVYKMLNLIDIEEKSLDSMMLKILRVSLC